MPGTVLKTKISIVSLTATNFIARDGLVLEQSYLWQKAALSLTQAVCAFLRISEDALSTCWDPHLSAILRL